MYVCFLHHSHACAVPFACVASSWDALLHCPEWEGVCAFGVSLRMCSMFADFVDHMIKVLLLCHFVGSFVQGL